MYTGQGKLVVAVAALGGLLAAGFGCTSDNPGESDKRRRARALNQELDRQGAFIRRIKQRSADEVRREYKRRRFRTHFGLHAVGQCVTTRRVGTRGDGGKWICNGYKLPLRGGSRRRCVVYSVGAGRNISFDRAMARRPYDCEVHLFDPGRKALERFARFRKGVQYRGGSLTMHPWALGPVSKDPDKARELVIDGDKVEVKTLDEITTALGHERVDVLKIDIEGGEWAAMADVLKKSLLERLDVQILLLELHVGGGFGSDVLDLVQLVEALRVQGLYVYRKEFNPLAPACCAEYAFVRGSFMLD